MRVAQQERKVYSHGGTNAQRATVKQSSKLFTVLSSGIYSNKEMAITREIWANAYDAHNMVGTPEKPFEVTFPTFFDPMFRVRDFGPGLSPWEVVNVYFNYLESTKDDADDAIGGWGLGGKTPYSYTDTFSLISWHKGKKYYWTATLDEEGFPYPQLMGEEDTTEPNGLEISFPVANRDVNSFARAAREISLGFDVKPTVTNQKGFEDWPRFNVIQEGEGWKLVDGRQSYAKMGCVTYPFDPEASGLSQKAKTLLKSPIIIDFNIGEVAVTVSREDLDYGRTKNTVENINKKAEVIFDSLIKQTNDNIKNAQSYFEAMCIANSVKKFPLEIAKAIRKNATYCGKAIFHHYEINRDLKTNRLNAHQNNNFTNKTVFWLPYTGVYANSKTVFFIEVLKKSKVDGWKKKDSYATHRIAKWWRDNRQNCEQILWFKYTPEDKDSSDDLIHILNFLGDKVKVIFVKDLEEHIKIGNNTVRNPVFAKNLKQNRVEIELSPGEFKKGGYYVKLNRGYVDDSNPYYIESCVRAINPDEHVIGVPKSLWKKFEKADQWKNFKEFTDKYFSEDIEGKKEYASSFVPCRRDKILCALFSDYAKIIEEYNKEKYGMSRQTMKQLLATYCIKVEDKISKPEQKSRQIYKDYPMLKYAIENYRYEKDDLIDYIRMVDNARKNLS